VLDAPPVALESVVVTATRSQAKACDVPAAISAVSAETIREAGPMVNLSESPGRTWMLSITARYRG
jgi:outer membrane receptor protein involved in Fe transport